jgi:hypothetical protein
LADDCNIHHRGKRVANLSRQDSEVAKQLVLEYFITHKELLDGKINHYRSEAIRQLSDTLNIPQETVRKVLITNKLVEKKLVIADGSQYKYIAENLPTLITKYYEQGGFNTMSPIWGKAKKIGITVYGLDIMFYLSGLHERISMTGNIHGIQTKCAKLNIDVDKLRGMVKPLLLSLHVI